MKILGKPFYRSPSDEEAIREDAPFANNEVGLFLVADGDSAAYCPNHPSARYSCCGLTGGQVASMMLVANAAAQMMSFDSYVFLRQVNEGVRQMHLTIGKDPCNGDDVGGASFAICRILENVVLTRLGGDCFKLWKDKAGFHFLNGFDEAARQVEEADINAFGECLEQASGNKGEAWNLYWPRYRAKRVRYANKSIGKGGWATLNGDPALLECLTLDRMTLTNGNEWILLGSDGMLHRHFRPSDAEELGKIYEHGGIPAILEWRDERDDQPHIGRGQWPEASAVEIKLEF